MNYITTSQTATKWNISANRITILAKNGRIPGAVKIGNSWAIPNNASKPYDARTKSVDVKYTDELFRFPSFAHKDLASFYPPLSNEEMKIKEAQEALHACKFDDVDTILGSLVWKTENRYIRIAALYTKCMNYIAISDSKAFLTTYTAIQAEFQTDFPYKIEMQEYLREINATIGFNNPYTDSEVIAIGYDYHKSFLPYLTIIPIIVLYTSINTKKLTKSDLLPFESNCLLAENNGDVFCTQTAHLFLGFCYAIIGEDEIAYFHIKKALTLAQKYNLLYQIISEYFYMSNVIEPVLKEFPIDFQIKIRKESNDAHSKYVGLMNKMSLKTIFNLILHKEYIYILYAVQGYSNKEISKLVGLNENTVAKKYSNIYSELGVSGKKELVAFYNNSQNPT